MSTTACARCEKQVPDDQLIPHGGKRICLECENELEDTARMRSSVHRSIASLPIVGATALLVLCIPIAGPFLSFLLAAFTIVVAIQGVRLGMSIRQDPEEYGVGDTEPMVLLVLGTLTGLFGVGLTVVSSVLVVLTLVAMG